MPESPSQQRFLKLTDVQEILQISSSQSYALVRSGELPAIRIGGRNQWRVEASRFEEYVDDAHKRTAHEIATAGRISHSDPIDEPADEDPWED